MDNKVNFYDLLGVNENATSEEIKLAYRAQIKKWHPDKNTADNAQEIASQLNEAKETLLDEIKRRDYDEYLKNRRDEQYQNLQQRQEQREQKRENTQTKKTVKKEKEVEEKLYTKWEYFKLYLKHYGISKFRKAIGIIFVLLETLLCSILSIINMLLAYIIVYLYELVDGFLTIGSLFMVLLVLQGINTETITQAGITLRLFIAAFLYISKYLLPTYASFLIYVNPKIINKLNIKLFGLAIGYKAPKKESK